MGNSNPLVSHSRDATARIAETRTGHMGRSGKGRGGVVSARLVYSNSHAGTVWNRRSGGYGRLCKVEFVMTHISRDCHFKNYLA
jgi:hypothetical protein